MCAYVNVQIIHIANICNSCKDIFKEVTNLWKDRQDYIQDYLMICNTFIHKMYHTVLIYNWNIYVPYYSSTYWAVDINIDEKNILHFLVLR